MKINDMLAEIHASGLNQTEIARRVEVSQGAISYLMTMEGRNPSWEVGLKILDLYWERCLKPSKARALKNMIDDLMGVE